MEEFILFLYIFITQILAIHLLNITTSKQLIGFIIIMFNNLCISLIYFRNI